MPGDKIPPLEMDAEIDFSKLEAGSKELEKVLAKLDPSLQRTEKGMKSVEKEGKKAGGTLSTLGAGFAKLTASIGLAQLSVDAFRRGLFALKQGLSQLMIKPIQEAIRFESIMAKVSTVLEDVSQQDIKMLGDQVLEMTKKFPKTKEELGLGLYEILQASVEDAGEAMQVLDFSTRAAVGGVTEVATAAKLATDIMGAYNLTAEETEEVMKDVFVGAQDGKAEFVDLAGSLGRVMGTAAQLNIEIPEVVAGIETMANAGFSAEMASTSMNSFLNSVIKASKGTSEASKVAEQLGLEYNSTALKAMGLQKFIEEVTKKAGNNEVALQALTQDVRAFRVTASLAGKGGEFFNQVLEHIEENTDALDVAFEKMNSTIESRLQIAWNRWNKAITEAGRRNAPEVSAAVDDLNESLLQNEQQVTDAATELSGTFIKGMQQVVEYAPELIGVLNQIASAAGAVVGAIGNVIREGNKLVLKRLHEEGSITDEQFDLRMMELSGVKTPAERQLELTMQQLNKKFNTNKPVTSEDAILQQELKEQIEQAQQQLDLSQLSGGGAREARKAEEEAKKRRKAILEFEADRAKVMALQLEVKRDTVGLTEREERILSRLEGAVEESFDVRVAEDFEEMMKALNGQTDALVDELEDVTGKIERIQGQIDSLMESSKERIRDLTVDLAEFEEEAAKEDEERLRQQARDLAKELVEAKKVTGGYVGGEFFHRDESSGRDDLEARRTAETIEGIIKEGEPLGKAVEEELQYYLDLEKANTGERLRIEQEYEDARIEQAREAKKREMEMNLELEKAFQEGKLDEFLEANDEELTARQKAHADELIKKEQDLKSQLTVQQNLQKDITAALTDQIPLRDEASENYTKREEARLGRIRTAALQAAAALAKARRKSLTPPTEASEVADVSAATGGYISGPGTSTSDSILAAVSDGEYVHKAASVRFYGREFMDAVNNMTLRLPKFAKGGPVSSKVTNNNSKALTFNYYGDAARVAADPSMIRWHSRKA